MSDVKMTINVDGIDFLINEPNQFDKICFLHKFKVPEMRNEVAISVITDERF